VKAVHGNVQWTHANSAVAARSFFQAGGVLPARQNILAGRITAPLWKNAVLGLDAAQDNRSGFVNGNILVPLAAERSCLSPEAAVCATINRFLRAWPTLEPNRTDIAARAPLRAALADDDVAGNDMLAAELLDAQPLAV
jgi:hypothetical protein